jgi:hypothetical protein
MCNSCIKFWADAPLHSPKTTVPSAVPSNPSTSNKPHRKGNLDIPIENVFMNRMLWQGRRGAYACGCCEHACGVSDRHPARA